MNKRFQSGDRAQFLSYENLIEAICKTGRHSPEYIKDVSSYADMECTIERYSSPDSVVICECRENTRKWRIFESFLKHVDVNVNPQVPELFGNQIFEVEK